MPAVAERHPRPIASTRRLVPALIDLARLGIASWWFGNIYESVVRVPERLAASVDDQGRASSLVPSKSVLGVGSPVRYYAVTAPITSATLVTALSCARRTGDGHGWLRLTTGSWIVGVGLTAYLVRTVNLPVFFAAEPPPTAQRDALLRKWRHVNLLRIAAGAIALITASLAQRAQREPAAPQTRR